jgi:tetratricopeptide (TPR) repeat protein
MAMAGGRIVFILAVAGLVILSGSSPMRAETKRPAGAKVSAAKPSAAKPSAAKPAETKPVAAEVDDGDQFLAASKFYQAINCYEHAYKILPEKNPLKERVLVNLAIAQLSLGRDEDAAESMKTLSTKYPTYQSLQRTHLDAVFNEFRHAASHTDEAATLLTEGKTRAAITEYEEAIEHMPYNAEFYSMLAFAYRTRYTRTKDEVAWRKAQRAFDTVKRLDPLEYDAIKADAGKP